MVPKSVKQERLVKNSKVCYDPPFRGDLLFMQKKDIIDILNKVLEFNFQDIDNKRSSKRTDILHSLINLYLKDKQDNDLYEIKFEQSLSCFYGTTFDVDVVLYKNKKIDSVFLFKMPQTSILKNRYNLLNTKVGELFRLTGSEQYKQDSFNIIFWEMFPTETLIVNKKNNKFSKEKVYEKMSSVQDIRKHPLLLSVKNFYDFKIWFKPNDNFFNAVKNNSFSTTADFIDDVIYDISNLPK